MEVYFINEKHRCCSIFNLISLSVEFLFSLKNYFGNMKDTKKELSAFYSFLSERCTLMILQFSFRKIYLVGEKNFTKSLVYDQPTYRLTCFTLCCLLLFILLHSVCGETCEFSKRYASNLD